MRNIRLLISFLGSLIILVVILLIPDPPIRTIAEGSITPSNMKVVIPTTSTTTTTLPPTTTTTSPIIPVTTKHASRSKPPTTKPRQVIVSSGGLPAFLVCVRQRESRGNYNAVNPSSGAGGAFQFLASTWRSTVTHAGRQDLLGTLPQHASHGDQDAMAIHLYNWQGKSPWGGHCP